MRTSSKIKIGLSLVQVVLLALILLSLCKTVPTTSSNVKPETEKRVVQVPEPSTFVLMLGALVLLSKNT